MMENYHLPNDIAVICVTATSFPEGIMAAFTRLQSLLPSTEGRTMYGISYMGQDGKIVYKAAANEVREGEAALLGCEQFIIRKGEYISERIDDFMNHIPQIGKTFQVMCSNPGIDGKGACIEWYVNQKDVICMVRLQDK